MTRAIWYRHWLEIRLPATIACIAVALLCLLPVTAALSRAPNPPPELNRSPWVGEFIWSSALVPFISLLLCGTGVRTGIAAPDHASLHYTLTLPVARFTLIWTRFAVGAAATAALFAALVTAGAAALLVAGRGIPLGAMAAASALAGLLAVALQAVGCLMSLWDTDRLALPTPVNVIAGVIVVWFIGANIDLTSALLSVVANQTAPWSIAGVLVLIVAAALCLAAVTARGRDF